MDYSQVSYINTILKPLFTFLFFAVVKLNLRIYVLDSLFTTLVPRNYFILVYEYKLVPKIKVETCFTVYIVCRDNYHLKNLEVGKVAECILTILLLLMLKFILQLHFLMYCVRFVLS